MGILTHNGGTVCQCEAGGSPFSALFHLALRLPAVRSPPPDAHSFGHLRVVHVRDGVSMRRARRGDARGGRRARASVDVWWWRKESHLMFVIL